MLFNRKEFRPPDDGSTISTKANLVLNVVIVAMALILLRLWHLSVVQYEARLEQSRKPQRKVVVEPAKRATIRDRFNIPLAINKVQYNVGLIYSELKQIPISIWEKDAHGNRVKRFKRKEYIAKLSSLLGKELEIDEERIEDLIHAKGPYYQQILFALKEDISEKEYYRLKMLEKDWLGIHVQRVPRRYYPFGKTAGDIIGYMGAINRQEYDAVLQEMKSLESYIEAIDTGEMPELPEGMKSDAEVIKRLKELQERSYTINDYIGKTGIEGHFEETLRGFYGKRSYYSDARGNYLRELPGAKAPLSGQRILLTISSELQAYAEELLIKNEKIRQTRVSTLDSIKRTFLAKKQPWIKGGAIVVMDPHSGEILAMASHPSFDPNDFIASGNLETKKKKRSNVLKWLESEEYLAEIWNQKRPLEREIFDEETQRFCEEKRFLNWENYIEMILAVGSKVKETVLKIDTVAKAVELQQSIGALLSLGEEGDLALLFNFLYHEKEHHEHGKKLTSFEKDRLERVFNQHLEFNSLKKKIDSYIGELSHTYDQILVVDLMRLAVNEQNFSDDLLEAIGTQSISSYRDASAAMTTIEEVVMAMTKEIFHDLDFKEWRELNEKEFLKQKRAEEKNLKKAAKPYTDYLDAKENELFQSFWKQNRLDFLIAILTGKGRSEGNLKPYWTHFFTWHAELVSGAHQALEWQGAYQILTKSLQSLNDDLAKQYLETLRGFKQLSRPLFGKYRHLRKDNHKQHLEKHLASAFYHRYGYGFGRSQAYRQSATQGSIFKLVTAYEALVQRYYQGDSLNIPSVLNPLEMTDVVYYKGKEQYLGYDATGQPLPRFYKGGRLPKSTSSSLGKLDIIKAIETSSNPYFALLAGDVLKSPSDLARAAEKFSFGKRTGIDLPGEISGNVPDDLESNRTGLYSMSIGQHTLVVTPLQTAVMLAAIANGGKILKPKIMRMRVGREDLSPEDLFAKEHFPYQENLSLVGIDFPLFTASLSRDRKSLIYYVPSKVQQEIFMPDKVRDVLFESMRRVVHKTQSESIGSLSRLYHNHPEAISDYIEMKDQLLGKTSTAESMENIDLDYNQGTNMYTHVWFGGVSFDLDDSETFVFKDSYGKPEVVVVVYLRYGGYGKEAAPIAAQMAKKWKEIKAARL